ncbi:ABC transporter ATP-binding protein [Haloarcula sp. GH36]|uniref:ABC transporter ATP-binding protein n=1 Tax=Haloarcula montana TaxID=3111776 RepID=UPI002D7864EE|nr:sn-glycerol-3-phosphate ABC transporter ATP-binding protein UgpC [Haloarcula sp. GH36]
MTSNTDAIPITLNGIGKQYGDVTAVTDLDMAIQPGEFLVIVGPSGCGKSTTLRMIAGLEDITSGELRFDGTVMNDVEPKDRNVAMVFQNYALYPHMSVARNMSFGMNSAGDYTQEEIDQRVGEAAETLGISAYLDRKPNQLSGGERQRVAIGRALVRDPDVLLLDEPLSNLDAKLRVEMRSELAALHDKVQTTSVYVTHDQTEAMTLGDRVAVLNEGELQQIDPPQELYDRPTNKFVGEFIGSPQMNFLPVDVRTANTQPLVTGETGEATSFEVALGGAPQVESGPYTLGVRPEDLYPVDTFDHSPREPITLEVDMTEPLGDVKLVYGMLAGQEIIVQVDPHYEVEKGERIELVADPNKLHLFDRQTGDCVYHSYDVAEEQQVEQGSQS